MGRGGRFGLSLTWPARRSDSFVKGLDCVSGVAYRDCALNRPKWGLERGYKASNAEIIRIFNMGRRIRQLTFRISLSFADASKRAMRSGRGRPGCGMEMAYRRSGT